MPKRFRIVTSVSPEELAAINDKARQAALNRAEFLRQAALGQQLRTRTEEELHRELIRLGLRLKAMQTQNNHADLEKVATEIRQALRLLPST